MQRDVGRLEGKVDGIAARQTEIAAQLARVVSHIDGEKASKRTLLAVGSVLSSIVGAVVGAAFSWWVGGNPPQ